MKYILILLCTTLFFSHTTKQKQTNVTGVLTFKSVSYTNFHGATEEQYQSLLKRVDSFLKNPKNTKNRRLFTYVAQLEKHKILRAPQIFVYIKDTITPIYLSEEAYTKVKHFNYGDLHRKQQKVILKLDIVKKEEYMYYAEKITDVSIVDGASKINGRVMKFMKQ